MNLDKNINIDSGVSEVSADEILILMKHEENRRLLKKLLQKQYQVSIRDRKEFDNDKYDLIILDNYALDKFSDMVRMMREREKPNYLPVLLIASRRKYQKIDQVLQIIIDELIRKPVGKQILKTRVQNLLQIRKLSLLYKKNYLALAENSPVGVCILYDRCIKYANPAFREICGRTKEEITGENILQYIKRDYRDSLQKYFNKNKINMNKQSIEVCIENSGEDRWVDIRLTDIIYQGKESIILIASDITERKKSAERVEHLSFHDKLTGVYNRAYYEEELERLNTERQLPLSIIMGDMNGLKMVNDAFGHEKGNQLLIKVGNIFKDSCRKEDIVARLGGDEFGILLPRTDEKEASKICDRIRKACNQVEEDPIELSIAMGVATKYNNSRTINEIFRDAEDRMYRNKIAKSESVRNSIISSLESTLQEKTYETKEHAKRMEKLAVEMGKKIGLNSGKLDVLKLLARLHDIGKVAVPENILTKPGKLTEQEFEKVKEHPESGYRIVKSVPHLAQVAQGVLSHHERWDGSGYPQGQEAEEIPYISRIISIVDTYDVMTHERAYKDASSKQEALKEIKRCSGSQFDPELVRIFVNIMGGNHSG